MISRNKPFQPIHHKFLDRIDAGNQLSKKLLKYQAENPVVIALPRGGVPVAAEIAKALNSPLEILIVKKIGVPVNPELAAGAIAEDSEAIFNEDVMSSCHLKPIDLKFSIEKKKQEILDLQRLFRKQSKALDLKNQTVILVDDGLATGATAKVAVMVLKQKKAKKIILAVPVAPQDTLNEFEKIVDEVICLLVPTYFMSVGEWYEIFEQVTNKEVLEELRLFKKKSYIDKVTLPIKIRVNGIELKGSAQYPRLHLRGWIVFAHGSGSSHKSPRNQKVANALNDAGFGTLLFDLLSPDEGVSRAKIFDISLLSERLITATRWLKKQSFYQSKPIFYFGASTGAAAAIAAAAKEGSVIQGVISRGGRPDLAEEFLSLVSCPVLLIVGALDQPVLSWNRHSAERISKSHLVIIPKASHLFSEPGTLEDVERAVVDWLNKIIEIPMKKTKKSERDLLSHY